MDFLLHLGKSSLYLILFYGFYLLLIRRTTFFQVNRAYLILSMILSLTLPFIELEEQVALEVSVGAAPVEETIPPIAYEETLSMASEPVAAQGTNPETLLMILYFAGLLISLGIFLYRLFTVLTMIRSHESTLYHGDPLVLLGEDAAIGSFSFFNRIFIRKSDSGQHFEQVYRHEKTHATQLHSLDILFVEILGVLFWFNPVMRLYKTALQEVHEFLADAAAADKDGYARFLVSYTLSGNGNYAIANPFFNSSTLKTRIEMMYKTPNPRTSLSRYLLIVPLAALLVSMTASKETTYITPEENAVQVNSAGTPPQTLTTTAQPHEALVLTHRADRKITGRVVDAADNEPLPGVNIVVKGTSTGTTTDTEGEFTLNVPDPHKEIVISFVGFSSQTIDISKKSEVNIALHKAKNELSEVVVVGYGFVKADSNTDAPSPQSSDDSKVYKAVEQVPEFPGGNKELYKYLARNIRYPGEAARANIQGKIYISFIVNKNGHIRNPKVLKGLGYGTDEEALRVVISMPSWKPGMQNGRPVNVEYTLPVSFKLELSEPKEQGHVTPATEDAPKELNVTPDNGTRIRIVGSETNETPYFSSPGELKYLRNAPRMGGNPELRPLILVDGQEARTYRNTGDLSDLHPNDIESITVLKDKSATSLYGEKAANGVILVTTKKAAKK